MTKHNAQERLGIFKAIAVFMSRDTKLIPEEIDTFRYCQVFLQEQINEAEAELKSEGPPDSSKKAPKKTIKS